MKKNIIKLDQEVCNAKKDLNRLVEDQAEYNLLYEQSKVTDKILIKYLDAKQHLEQERRKIMKDYSELLDTSFRFEITSKINQEVKKDFPNARDKELNHFSNNVYVYALLKAYNIEERDIIEQLLYLNNSYFEEMLEDGVIKDSGIKCNNLEYLTNLNEKISKHDKKENIA